MNTSIPGLNETLNGSFIRGVTVMYDTKLGGIGIFILLMAMLTLAILYLKTQSWTAVGVGSIVMLGVLFAEIRYQYHYTFYVFFILMVAVALYGFFWKSKTP